MAKEAEQTKLPAFYFSFQVFWLRVTGIEVLKENESVPYRIYSTFIILLIVTFMIVEANELRYQNDFDTIAIIGWYVISHILTLARVGVIYKNRKEIGNIMKSFHKGFYKPNRRLGKFEEQCISKILGQSRFQMIQYGIFMAIACSSGFVGSLVTRFTESPENWRLPYITFSLVNTTYSPAFEVACFYQFLTAAIICMWLYICDCTVVLIIAQTAAQLKILENRIRNYRSTAIQTQIEEKDKMVEKNLRRIIIHHNNLIETISLIESLCSYLVLFVFLANIILLCLIMYYTSLIPIVSVEFVRFLSYVALVAVQTLMYCWWGNEVTLANEKLATGIFETYDPDDPTPYAKALKLMLVKAQKPLFFTAGKFAPLSLETYKGIIKGSFSYFTVLRQVNVK